MHIQNVWGASKVYYRRCANGEWNPVPFVRSSCYCGCGREGSDIKTDRKVFCFIICHLGRKKLKVAFKRAWQLHFFITFATPMSEKIMINLPSCVSRTKTLSLVFRHQYSQGVIIGPLLLFTVSQYAERFISSKSIHIILSPMSEN